MAAERLAAALALLLAAAPARAALSANAEQALDRGLHHLYSLDYAEARGDFRKLIEQEPDNPFGYLFESGAIWWQSSQEYGLFKDTPTLQGLFEQDVDMAVKKAEALTKSRDKGEKADGNFVAGMALGTRGQWALMRGHYMGAFFDAKSAVKHLKKVPKIDPDYRDVDLGLGVYDYEMAHLQGLAKLSGLLGVRGDEKKGLEELRSGMERGRYARRQSAEFLAMIYILDKKDWAAALPVVESLGRDIPESPYYDSLEALVLWRLGRKDESLAAGRELFEKAREDPAAWDRKLLSLACGLAGDQCLGRAHAAGLREWLTAAIEAEPSKPTPYLTLLRLYRGWTAEALGRSADAEADYAWVVKHPDFAGARARAQACLDDGCAPNQVLLRLRELSRGEAARPAVPAARR